MLEQTGGTLSSTDKRDLYFLPGKCKTYWEIPFMLTAPSLLEYKYIFNIKNVWEHMTIFEHLINIDWKNTLWQEAFTSWIIFKLTCILLISAVSAYF